LHWQTLPRCLGRATNRETRLHPSMGQSNQRLEYSKVSLALVVRSPRADSLGHKSVVVDWASPIASGKASDAGGFQHLGQTNSRLESSELVRKGFWKLNLEWGTRAHRYSLLVAKLASCSVFSKRVF
jgi:hypothetical protein